MISKLRGFNQVRSLEFDKRELVNFQHCKERFLWNLDVPHRFHAFLTLFLFLEEFALTGDISAVTFRRYVLAERTDDFGRDNFPADGRLDFHLELLARNNLFQLLRQRTSPALRLRAMNDA